MSDLHIQIQWPDGAYHGGEWPPSPLRLFQALIAGYRTAQPAVSELDSALRHLECLSPPIIAAPLAIPQAPCAAAVPNNDTDKIVEAFRKGNDQRARRLESKLITIRRRDARRFDGPVTYSWQTNQASRGHAAALQRLCSHLYALGQGTDLAWARTWFGDGPGDLPVYRPAPDGPRELPVPDVGAYERLAAQYHASRTSIDGSYVHNILEPNHRRVRYRSELEPPGRRWIAFALQRPDSDRAWSISGERLFEVAAMTRHAIHDASRRAGLTTDQIGIVMGHAGDERISTQPLCNVGHAYADGRVRRVLLTAPLMLDSGIWDAITHRLAGIDLTPPGSGGVLATLAQPGQDDKLLWRYTVESQEWTTATPAILPGWDHRRGKPRPERSIRRMLRHAGIPDALLQSVSLEPAPRIRGSLPASQYRRPSHLAKLPTTHLSIRWKHPVKGPWALGAGIGYGFGVFVAI